MSRMQQSNKPAQHGNAVESKVNHEQHSALDQAMGVSRERFAASVGNHLSSLHAESEPHHKAQKEHAHTKNPALDGLAEAIHQATHQGWRQQYSALLKLMPGVPLVDLKPFREIERRFQSELGDQISAEGESQVLPVPKFPKNVLSSYAAKYLPRGADAADAAAAIGKRMNSEKYEALTMMFGIDVSRDVGSILMNKEASVSAHMSDHKLHEILGQDAAISDAHLDRVRLGLSLVTGTPVRR